MVLAVSVAPGQATDDDAVVLLPGTEINVCASATVEDLVEVEATAQVLLDKAGVEFADLKALCDAAPVAVTPAPADGGGGGQVDVIPSGAPETGDGSTEQQMPWTVAVLSAVGLTAAGGLLFSARRPLPTRR